MKNVLLQIEAELHDKVKKSAKENERSVNAHIRYLIRQQLKQMKTN